MSVRTKDLYCAAFMVARGQEISKTEKENGAVFFTFNSDQADEYLTQYFIDGNLNVNAKNYASQVRVLKGLIHSRAEIR